MYCIKCQDILDLDILLSTHSNHPGNDGQPQPREHYESFAAMQESATAGCELCRLACSVPSGSYLAELRSLPPGESAISWEFAAHDILHFESRARRQNMSPQEPRFRGLTLSAVEGY
jgi:hypothetical protein